VIFRQFIDPETSTQTYLLADESTREAVLIDPVLEQFDRDRTLLRELGPAVVLLESDAERAHLNRGWIFFFDSTNGGGPPSRPRTHRAQHRVAHALIAEPRTID